jgi:peptide deformylase
LENIGSAKIKKIIEEMKVSLKSQDDGVAIAAPQIGYSVRIFVVAGKIFDKDYAENRAEKLGSDNQTDTEQILDDIDDLEDVVTSPDLVFINPKISRLSRDKEWMPEGCLSVRWLYGKTFRSKKATVTAYDENGKKFTRGASGLLAQIFQHETDHLNGILFVDHAKDIREELPK